MLKQADLSALLIKERSCKTYIVAAPHHAPIGCKKLPCDEHSVSDEGAGYVAWDLAEKLNCHSIIALNYFIDVNKSKTTDYFCRLEKWEPVILVEIHGHGSKGNSFDIEVSSGSRNNEWSCKLAEFLRGRFKRSSRLGNYSICGDFNKIKYKARESLTINNNKWLSFHIELPKSIRQCRREYSLFNKYLRESLVTIRQEMVSS